MSASLGFQIWRRATDGAAVAAVVDASDRVRAVVESLSGARTPSDAMANPTTAIDAVAFLAGWDGTNWGRVRIVSNVNGYSVTTDPTAGALLTVASVGGWYSVANGTYRQRMSAYGQAAVVLDGTNYPAWTAYDNVDLSGYTMQWVAAPCARIRTASLGGTAGRGAWLTLDTLGNLATFTGLHDLNRTNADDPSRAIAVDTGDANIKASAAHLYALYVENREAATRWINLHDKASPVTSGVDTTSLSFAVPAGFQGWLLLERMRPLAFTNGLRICLSTTVFTYTADGSPLCTFVAFYK